MLEQSTSISKSLIIPEANIAELFGQNDKNIKIVKQALGTAISYVGGQLTVTGVPEDVRKTLDVLSHLEQIMLSKGLSSDDVENTLRLIQYERVEDIEDITSGRIKVAGATKYVSPKSRVQKAYIEQIQEKDMVFAYGPAGTGKTFLAVAMAVHYYLQKKIRKIILTRPAVEAGEKLGFLPGDLAEKINPYLRPLYDALNAMLDEEVALKLIERGILEVAPLAFMRGRTLSDAFVILDEAQNTTPIQMKMFLTRLGFRSKAVITGDITQVDLPKEQGSGLSDAITRLSGINDIGFIELTEQDVVRNPLVTKIIRAYDDEYTNR